jgi:hypothetical protein
LALVNRGAARVTWFMTRITSAELGYLRGPFDAERMIRLDFLPEPVVKAFTSGYTAVQQIFPAVDRNSVYLTWSVNAELDGKPAAAVVNRYALKAPLVVIGGEYFATEERIAATLARVIEADLSDPAIPFTVPPDRSLQGHVRHVAIHEHGHTLFEEFTKVYGPRNVLARFLPVIEQVLPGYTPQKHADFREALAHQGVLRHGRGSFRELIPELFAMNSTGRLTDLSAAVAGVFATLNTPESHEDREQRLLMAAADLFEDRSLRTHDEPSEQGDDLRFLRLLAQEHSRTGETFGPSVTMRTIDELLNGARPSDENAVVVLGAR